MLINLSTGNFYTKKKDLITLTDWSPPGGSGRLQKELHASKKQLQSRPPNTFIVSNIRASSCDKTGQRNILNYAGFCRKKCRNCCFFLLIVAGKVNFHSPHGTVWCFKRLCFWPKWFFMFSLDICDWTGSKGSETGRAVTLSGLKSQLFRSIWRQTDWKMFSEGFCRYLVVCLLFSATVFIPRSDNPFWNRFDSFGHRLFLRLKWTPWRRLDRPAVDVWRTFFWFDLKLQTRHMSLHCVWTGPSFERSEPLEFRAVPGSQLWLEQTEMWRCVFISLRLVLFLIQSIVSRLRQMWKH